MEPPVCEICCPDYFRRNVSTLTITLTPLGITSSTSTTSPPELVDPIRTRLVNHVSFVDCPGHEMLMTTMLNGTAVMDCAMMVIAANEKIPQPQTQEHLIAAEMMGLNNIILIQNKIDLVNRQSVETNAGEILEWVKGTCAEGSPLIPISAQFGFGVQRIIEALADLKPSNRGVDKTPIFACIRSFDVNKPGTLIGDLNGGVIGGTLLQGSLNVGDKIEIRPGVKCSNEKGETCYVPFVTNVTTIRSENNALQTVIPGGLIAIGTDLDPYFTTKDNLVGCILGTNLPELSEIIEIRYNLLKGASVKSFKVNDSVRITALSRTVMATVVEVNPKRTIKIKLSEPLCIIEGFAKFSISIQEKKQWRLVGLAMLIVDGKVPKMFGDISPDFGRSLPKYEVLYEEIISKHKLSAAAKVVQLNLDPPVCAKRGGARTIWVNFGKIVDQMKRPKEHFRTFVGNELATQTSLTEKDEMILYGTFRSENFESIIRSYIKSYCKCNNCGNCATTLQEDSNVDIVICSYCGRNQMIASTNQAIPKKGKGGKIKII